MPKQFVHLGGIPLIVHPLRVLHSRPWRARLIVVYAKNQRDHLVGILQEFDLGDCVLVEGGDTRQESVRRGLEHVTTPRVVVHNAAVALVQPSTVDAVVSIDADCVTTTLPLEVNLVRGDAVAANAVSREGLKIINSPQVFRTDVLRHCHEEARRRGLSFASEAELMLHFGRNVRLVPGPASNFKITTPLDLLVAEALLAQGGVPTLPRPLVNHAPA